MLASHLVVPSFIKRINSKPSSTSRSSCWESGYSERC